MAINDALLSLTEREIKYLKDSWVETFSKKIFPFINEDRFKVLYSDNTASRSNNPANVYLGLLILREIFNQSNEEVLNSLMFELRYQCALHTTSFQDQPVSSAFKKGSYRAHFNKKHCSNCPLRKDCLVVKQKKSYIFRVSETKLRRCQLIAKMGPPSIKS